MIKRKKRRLMSVAVLIREQWALGVHPWCVEMGNAGPRYYIWRYGQD